MNAHPINFIFLNEKITNNFQEEDWPLTLSGVSYAFNINSTLSSWGFHMLQAHAAMYLILMLNLLLIMYFKMHQSDHWWLDFETYTWQANLDRCHSNLFSTDYKIKCFIIYFIFFSNILYMNIYFVYSCFHIIFLISLFITEWICSL